MGYYASVYSFRNSQGKIVPSSSRNAFTLVEMLVVVALIVVLAALVLPALAGAKQRSIRAQCVNNQKQLGMANAMYVGDNRDWLAFCNCDGGASVVPIPGAAASKGPWITGWLYTCKYGSIPNPNSPQWSNNPASAWYGGAWWPYVQNNKAYLCPADLLSKDYLPPAPAGRANKLSSYVMNAAAAGFPSASDGSRRAYQSTKAAEIWSPSCFLFWEPNEDTLGLGNPGASVFKDGAAIPSTPESSPAGVAGISSIHDKTGGNISRIDGASEFITVEQFQHESKGPPGDAPDGLKTRLWWSIYSANGH